MHEGRAHTTAPGTNLPAERRGHSAVVAAVSWLVCGFGVLALAKGMQLVHRDAFAPSLAGWVMLDDAAVFGFAIAATVWLGGRARWLDGAMAVGAWSVAMLSVANAVVLLQLGEQAHWQLLLYARDKAAEMPSLIRHGMGGFELLGACGLSAAVTVAPVVGWWLVRRRSWSLVRRRGRWLVVALLVAVVVKAVVVEPPVERGTHLRYRSLGQSWPLRLARSAQYVLAPSGFGGIKRTRLLADRRANDAAAGTPERPNVVVIVLESTRWDHTSLNPKSPVSTPALAALARRGTVAVNARAVVPHTTKALFSIFCGRLPTIHAGELEVSAAIDPQCLPAALAEFGYATAFMQSANGVFEQRPRLVAKLGFQRFDAREDSGRPLQGYLASDDAHLHEPFAALLADTPSERPIFAALLTSSTHHPYSLPAPVAGLPFAATWTTPAARYRYLVARQDALIGRVIDALRSAGRFSNTIVAVVGDHGEGFGEKGVRQHDNNFYEEGLRVPFVIAGPGVPARVVKANATVADLAPTLAALVGRPVADGALHPQVAADLLAPRFADIGPRVFACFSHWRCRGFVAGDHKVIDAPELGATWSFDVRADPDERVSLPVPGELQRHVEAVRALIDSRRVRRWNSPGEDVPALRPWTCPEGEPRCRHPRASRPRDRYQPSEVVSAPLPDAATDAYAWLEGPKPLRIAHRLGGATPATENTSAAFYAAYKRGFRLFEVDLQLTTDGRLACLHSDGPHRPMTWSDYLAGRRQGQACSFRTLIELARDKPDVRFVLDVKRRFRRSYARIGRIARGAGLAGRFIPQVYRFPELRQVRSERMPDGRPVFPGAIFTAYRSRLDTPTILASARRLGVRAVTLNSMRLRRREEALPADLTTFAHPVNDLAPARRRIGIGIDGIYTHALPPSVPIPATNQVGSRR